MNAQAESFTFANFTVASTNPGMISQMIAHLLNPKGHADLMEYTGLETNFHTLLCVYIRREGRRQKDS